MDNLAGVLLGAVIAIVGGLIFRVYEATQQRDHWFRDHVREAAEQFLTHAQRHLDVSWEKMVGELPDGSQAIRPPTAALEVDISRLQLVAPQGVADEASVVFQKLKAAFDAAQRTPHAFDQEKFKAADAAWKDASDEIVRFAEVVRRDLSRVRIGLAR